MRAIMKTIKVWVGNWVIPVRALYKWSNSQSVINIKYLVRRNLSLHSWSFWPVYLCLIQEHHELIANHASTIRDSAVSSTSGS